ncbi:DMT family transporter [Lusitaniella coriacea]|uniref:DMT family transporter n=1 Tax=Lusitaniella coriacea TaxID=1983105 RepID=UPI003CF24164
MENTKKLGYTAAITSAMLLAPIGIFVRNISATGYIITFARLGLGLIFLVVFLILKKDIKNIRNTGFSWFLLPTGILMSAIVLCYINAVSNISLANAVFLLYLGPLMAVGIAAVILKEKLTILNGGLLCLAFLGFSFLLEFKFSLNIDESQGYLWGIGAAMCYALYIVLNRKIPESIPVLTRSFYQLIFGAIAMLPFLDASFFSLTTKDIGWLIAVGFFQGFLAISLVISAVKYLKAVEYGTISYIEPLIASLIGFFLYSESLTLLQFIGCAIVFAGGIIQVVATKNS